MRKLYSILLGILLILAFSSCEQQPLEIEDEVISGGISFHVKYRISQGPTVIFENGLTTPLSTWKALTDSLPSEISYFSYDRAGVGDSQMSPNERTVPNMVTELKELLASQNIPGPYIYVAHSFGSYLGRYFATKYPEEIKSLILVDPAPDLMYDAYTEQDIADYKKIAGDGYVNAPVGEQLEWEQYLENRKYVQAEPVPDQVPMIILTATQWDFYEYHAEILNENPQSKHLKVEGSHDLHKEKPQLISRFIKRASRRLDR